MGNLRRPRGGCLKGNEASDQERSDRWFRLATFQSPPASPLSTRSSSTAQRSPPARSARQQRSFDRSAAYHRRNGDAQVAATAPTWHQQPNRTQQPGRWDVGRFSRPRCEPRRSLTRRRATTASRSAPRSPSRAVSLSLSTRGTGPSAGISARHLSPRTHRTSPQPTRAARRAFFLLLATGTT